MSSEDGIEQTFALRMINFIRTLKRSNTDDGWVVVSAEGSPTSEVSAIQAPAFSDFSDEAVDAPAVVARLLPLTVAAEEISAAEWVAETPATDWMAEAPTDELSGTAVASAYEDWTPVLLSNEVLSSRGSAGSGSRPAGSTGWSRDHGRTVVARDKAQERKAARHGLLTGLSRHRFAAKAGVATLATAALIAGSAGGAFANAANPAPSTTGSAVVHPDGTVTVTISGTWVWPGQSCAGRYGEGYAVDWWGVNASSAATPSFSLTNATEVTGVAATTVGTISPAGSILYKAGGTYFHVAQYYAGQDINTAGTCSDSVAGGGGGNDTSSGPWTASATYPNVGDVPAQLCSIFYDEHGSQGKASGSASDFSPTKDNDNSIDTNAFNPAAGQGYCLSTTFLPALKIVKTGPATGLPNGQGTYTMTATNTGNAPATAVVIKDDIPTGETFSASGSTAGCTLASTTDAGYAQTVNCPVGTIAGVGGTATVTIVVNYGANVTGQTLTDCATASNASMTSNQSCVPTTFPALSIVKTGPATGLANGQGTYQMTATNSGTMDDANVVIKDDIPAGETFSASGSTSGCTLASTADAGYAQTVNCPVGTIAKGGGTASVTIVVTYASDASGTLTDCATASNGTVTSNQSCVPTKVGQILVGVVKTNNAADPTGTNFQKTETAANLGETFTYQAVITNTSTVAETITTVTDNVPQGSSTTVNVCNGTSGTNVIGTLLQPAQSTTCTFQGTAPTGSGDSLTDLVTVTTQNPNNPTQISTGTDTSTVLTTPTVLITKANDANGDGVFTGSEVAAAGATSVPYQVVVTNNNASPGTITTLTDSVNGTTADICTDLIGDVLQPGQSATCNFTGPVPTTPTTDTAAVTLSVNGILVTATAPSTVSPPVLGEVITNPPTTPAPVAVAPTQLAFTGAPVRNLLRWTGMLVLMGLTLLGGLTMTDPRRRRLALVRAGWVNSGNQDDDLGWGGDASGWRPQG